MGTTVLGRDIMMYVDKDGAGIGAPVAVGCAQSSTLSLSTEFIQASCKGDSGWNEGVPGAKSWTMSTDGLYQLDANMGVIDFFDLWNNKTKVTLKFGTATTGDEQFQGEAYVVSLEMNAPNGEEATYSVSFQGTGAITKITAA